ncbi:hypothetical protein EWW49_29215, partial [Pseudomonas syringae]
FAAARGFERIKIMKLLAQRRAPVAAIGLIVRAAGGLQQTPEPRGVADGLAHMAVPAQSNPLMLARPVEAVIGSATGSPTAATSTASRVVAPAGAPRRRCGAGGRRRWKAAPAQSVRRSAPRGCDDAATDRPDRWAARRCNPGRLD